MELEAAAVLVTIKPASTAGGQKEEVTNAGVLKEKCQASQNQPESRSVLHVVLVTEGSEIGRGNSMADESTQNISETQKEEVANAKVVKEGCQVLKHQPEGTPVSHNVTELAGSETGEGQEGTMRPQLSSSEKSGDITADIEKQQNYEQIIDYLKSEVERLEAINSGLRFEAAEVSERLGGATLNLESLKKIRQDEDVAQERMSPAVVAHALKNQSATKDAEEQTSDMPSEIKAREAEKKYLAAKIRRQEKEICSLSMKNNELLEQYEAENARNEKDEEMLKIWKEKAIEEPKILFELNRGKHEAVMKIMEEQRSMMIGLAGSTMASLSDKLQTLETALEERCKLLQRQLSNCTREIEMVRRPLRGQKMTDEDDELIMKFLSTDIKNAVLHETNRSMEERLEEDARLLERYLKSQRKLKRVKKKVEARQKKLAARTEETEKAIIHLTDAVDYYRERFHQLREHYHARERQST